MGMRFACLPALLGAALLPAAEEISTAAGVRAFHPKIVYPYHSRGSDTKAFAKALAGTGIDVRLLDWYGS